MRNQRARLIVTAGLLAALCGCAADPTRPDVRPQQLPDMTLDCIVVRTIDDWKVLDSHNVVIYAPTRQTAYLVELLTACVQLPTAEAIGIESRQGERLCSFAGDALLVGTQRCPIGAIRPYHTESTITPDPPPLAPRQPLK
jgi:hypothetical protein